MAANALDKFGKFLMTRCRDQGIDFFDQVAAKKLKAPALKSLQADLAKLSEQQRAVVRRLIIRTLDTALHDLLFALQENADTANDIQIVVDGVNIAEDSDGIQGEPFGEDGWQARFSKHGMAPETP